MMGPSKWETRKTTNWIVRGRAPLGLYRIHAANHQTEQVYRKRKMTPPRTRLQRQLGKACPERRFCCEAVLRETTQWGISWDKSENTDDRSRQLARKPREMNEKQYLGEESQSSKETRHLNDEEAANNTENAPSLPIGTRKARSF